MLVSRKFLGAFVAVALTVAWATPAPAVVTQWEPLGPYGGDRFEVRISPIDNQILFVHGGRGIHRSVDAGANWTSVSTPEMIQYNSILTMEFDPMDSQAAYLGGTAKGVWRSGDGGVNWTQASAGIPLRAPSLNAYASIYSLAFDHSGVLYAGSSDPALIDDPSSAWLYKSSDRGDNWTPADSGITITAPTLNQDPKVLVSKDLEGQVWAVVYGGGVFRLEHGSWVAHNGNLPQSALLGTFLAHHPTEAGHMFLGTEDAWVFESVDYGATWSQMVLPDDLISLPTLPLVYCVAIDPNNPGIVVIRANDSFGSDEQALYKPRADQTAGRGLFYTFDAGATWINRSAFLFRMTFDPSEIIEDVIAGVGVVKRSKVSYITSGGAMCVQKSVDGQTTFDVSIEGIDNVLINAVFAHSNPPGPYGELIYGAAESGNFITDGGVAPVWKRQNPVQDYLYTWSFAENFNDRNKVFYSTGNPAWDFPGQRGVYELDVSCLTDPETICPPGPQLLADVGVWKVVTTPADPLKVYAACQEDGILVSDNGGQTWAPFNAGLTLPISITDIVLAPDGTPLYASSRAADGDPSDDPDDFWVPSRGEAGAIYSYSTGLSQWEKVSGVDLAVMALDFDVANDVHLAATVQGIYRTTNDWNTWEQREWTNIFTDVLVDPSRPNTIYASSHDGVFRAVDGGLSWQDISNNIAALEVNQLALDVNSGTLYAATSGSSVCRMLPDSPSRPRIAFDISAIDFGPTPVGFMSESSIIITNYGEADLNVSGIVPDHGDFTIIESFPQTLAPWTTSVVTARFSPTATGVVSAYAVISSDDPDAPTIYFPFDGEGVTPIPPVPDVKVNGSDGPVTIDAGTGASVTVDVAPGDYLGRPAEFWISVDTPYGMQWLVEGTGWVPSVTPIPFNVGGTISNQPILIEMGSELPIGDYDFRCNVDDVINGAFDPVWQDTLSLTIQPVVAPAPDLKLNGQGGSVSVPYGTQATLSVDLTAGDYLGQPAEFWISADTPLGKYWFVEGSGWTPSATPVVFKVGGVIADMGFLIDLGSAFPTGGYTYKFTVDNIVNGALDQVWLDTLSVTITAADPVPDIGVNGQDGPMSQDFGTAVSLNISLSSGGYGGTPAELWIKAQTPVGQYWYVAGPGWTRSSTPICGASVAISDFSLPFDLGSTLPAGSYQFEFIVDNVVNGALDSIWRDSVSLIVQ